MPNWKNPDEYKFADHLDPRGWAWEFLRRNPAYRAHWQELSASAAPLVQKYGALNEWPKKSALLKMENAWVAHPLLGTLELLPVAAGRAWSLECMCDPYACEAKDVKFLDLPHPPPIWTGAWDVSPFVGGMEEVVPKGIYTWIRLDAAIEPQLESLRKTLMQMQNELQFDPEPSGETRKRQEMYKRYIVVLDAREAGASYGEIAETLVNASYEVIAKALDNDDPVQTVKDWAKAAKKRVNGGWKSLLSK